MKEMTCLEKKDIYRLNQNTVLEHYEVDPQVGLTSAEAESRRLHFGPNRLEEEKKETFLQKLLNQFKDFLIIILIIAAALSGALGEMADAIIILAIVVVNAILGVIQEGRAEKAIEALQKMSAPSARLLRNGEQMLLPAEDLVPGDIVILEAGDIVPADIRLLRSSNLKAEESSLTGESVPVEKDAAFSTKEEKGIGDRSNMVFSGTSITYGSASGVVVLTGENTEVGSIATRLKSIESEATPLQKNLNHLGKVLGIVCIVVCILVFVAGLLQGGEPVTLFLTAVSLAVAAIPEGLPAVVTIVLALGMNRMAEEHAIVKRLLAVETLGSIDTICSDKTGTLTQNEMTVTCLYVGDKDYTVTGSGYAPEGDILLCGDGEEDEQQSRKLGRLLEIALLCNDAELKQNDDQLWTILGDPTEGALLTLAAKVGFWRKDLQEKVQYLGDLPFDSIRKMMSVFYEGFPEGKLSLTKGAPDILLSHCSYEMQQGKLVKLSEERRKAILAKNSEMARKALRVLAYAYKIHDPENSAEAENDMIFVGLSGMIDPSRPEAREAIRVCKKAGIRCVMITGDYAETALAIAKDLDLAEEGDKVLTGTELDKMSDEDIQAVCETVPVYARVSPEHKVRIVSALRKCGHAASMTGDGVNDAPALKQADIGVAMGITGTEVAKGSAEMILTDDNFATIVSAVREGRIIYSNIRKFVSFLLSCNVGEILVIFITNLLLGPNYAPLLPIQLLWLNLVTDSFPALALGQEKGEADIMQQPPRDQNEHIINKEMVGSIIVQALAIFLAVFAAFQFGRYFYPDYATEQHEVIMTAAGTPELISNFHFFAAENGAPSDGARTFAFVTLITAELIRAFSCRSERKSVFKIGLFTNPTMNRSILLAFALMLVVVFVPALDLLFHTISPNLRDWLIMIGLAFVPFICGELYKYFMHRDER